MLGKGLKFFLQHPLWLTGSLLADPLEMWLKVQDRLAESRERQGPVHRFEAEADWEPRLHDLLGVRFPCPAAAEFACLRPTVIGEMEAHGLRVGPMGFGGWNDGDAGLVRAIWCLVRHLRPRHVVETGVAHGVTSRFILEALELDGAGDLSSIDLPPFDRVLQSQIGVAVDGRFSTRWSYIKGSSRRRLPGLLARLGAIQLFVHDSLHSERNVRFELDRAWRALRPGGAIVVDDIDGNNGFRSFTQAFSGHTALVCDS